MKIRYIEKSHKLIIEGRIISYYKKETGRVKNFDDIMIEEDTSFNTIFKVVEENLIDAIFPVRSNPISLNLLYSKVTSIEYCVNLDVESQSNVKAYITLLNLIFIDKNNEKCINHVIEAGIENLYSSCHIKSKGQYKSGKSTLSCINFYNKYDQLDNEDKRGWNADYIEMHNESIEEAKVILRLEVQLGSQALYNLRTKHKMSNVLKNYANLDLAYDLISQKYKYFFGEGDLYSFKELKKVIKNSSMTELEQKNILAEYSKYNKILGQELLYRRKIPKEDHYKFPYSYAKKIKALGINPILIPSKFNITYLESPVKLLSKKREKLKVFIDMQKRQNAQLKLKRDAVIAEAIKLINQ